MRPEAKIKKCIGRHRLTGVMVAGKWTFCCPSWPALAVLHSGAGDATAIVEEFERRATGGVPRVRCEVMRHTNPVCVVFHAEER